MSSEVYFISIALFSTFMQPFYSYIIHAFVLSLSCVLEDTFTTYSNGVLAREMYDYTAKAHEIQYNKYLDSESITFISPLVFN